jgi:hypothetical protein
VFHGLASKGTDYPQAKANALKGAMARVVQPFSNRLIDHHEVDFPVDPATVNRECSMAAESDLTTALKCHLNHRTRHLM